MRKTVPTYELYGEKTGERPDFWLHCETIPSRSSLYHWEIGLHRHESFFQILYIAGGSGDAVFGNAVNMIEPPMVIPFRRRSATASASRATLTASSSPSLLRT